MMIPSLLSQIRRMRRHGFMAIFIFLVFVCQYTFEWHAGKRMLQWKGKTEEGQDTYQLIKGIEFHTKDFLVPTEATIYKADDRTDVCFVTFEFGPPGNVLEPLANLTTLGVRLPSDGTTNYRYLAFVNENSTDTGDWDRIVVQPDPRFTRPKTMASKFKFVAWQHPATYSCRTIFPMDGTKFPAPQAKVWDDLEKRVHATPGGLLLQRKGKNIKVMTLLDKLVVWRKDIPTNIDKTKEWLLSRDDFDPELVCLFTQFFGYDPANSVYQQMSSDFWKHYSTETLTARDQPLFSYFVDLYYHDLHPDYLRHYGFEALRKANSPDYELLPYIDVCREAKLNMLRLQGKSIDQRYEVDAQIPTMFDPKLVEELCERSKAHEFTGMQSYSV